MKKEDAKARILGVSASPRQANTYYAVKDALQAAEEFEFVSETEFIDLSQLNLLRSLFEI